jgi:hypothetical protein
VAPQRGFSTWLLNGASPWAPFAARFSQTTVWSALELSQRLQGLLIGIHPCYLCGLCPHATRRGFSTEAYPGFDGRRQSPTLNSGPIPSSRLLISSLPPCSVISMPVVNFSPLVWQLCHHQLPVIQTTLVVISVPSKCSNHSDRIWKSSTHLKFQHTTSLFTNLSGIVDDPTTSPTLVSLAQPSSAITPSHSLPSVLFTIAIWPVETCRKMSLAAQNEATANFHTIYHFVVIKRELAHFFGNTPHPQQHALIDSPLCRPHYYPPQSPSSTALGISTGANCFSLSSVPALTSDSPTTRDSTSPSH